MNNENNKLKQKIDLLLKKKRQSDELDKYLDLYRKLDEYIESKPTILDSLKVAIAPIDLPIYHSINFRRLDIPNRQIQINVNCSELLLALRDFYARQILDLTEGENSPQQ
jgi:hypothetical protein